MFRASSIYVLTLSFLAMSCAESPDDVPPAREVLGTVEADFVAQRTEGVAYALTTLPTSAVLVSGNDGVICYSHRGDELWRYEMPADDQISASPAYAPNSTVYVLSKKSLSAISNEGVIVWSIDSEPAEIPAVLALGDSTVVVTSGANALVNYDDQGRPQWRFELPDGDTIASVPKAANNSQVYVQGQRRIYVIDPSGLPVWDREL